MFFLKKRGPELAIDLGTRNLLVSNQQQILYSEQNVAAYSHKDEKREKIICGSFAQNLFEKNPGNYDLLQPLRQGVIQNTKLCAKILNFALHKIRKNRFHKPQLLMSVPLDTSLLERKAFHDVAIQAGASSVTLIPEVAADAVGMLPHFTQKKGIIVVDIGAGITECVLFSMGGVVCNKSLRMGGDDLELGIRKFIRSKYQFEIGPQSIFLLLDTMAHNRNEAFLKPIEIKGFDLIKKLPSTFEVEMKDIDTCLDSYFIKVTECLRQLLEIAPEELSSEILSNGIFLTGGASQFPRLLEIIEEKINIQTSPDAQPLLGVARGEIRLLQDPALLKILEMPLS